MDWNRAELKLKAKAILSKTYVVAFFISIILAIAGGEHDGANSNKKQQYKMNNNIEQRANMYISIGPIEFDIKPYDIRLNEEYIYSMFLSPVQNLLGNLLNYSYYSIMVSVFFMVLVFRIILGYCLEVGARKYFIETAGGEVSGYDRLLYVFKNRCWLNVTIVMFLRNLYTFLSYFLLIIPGVIKSYAYMMVPYILADNPEMNANTALQISEEMTMGHKMDMFVLDLSFIGWYILSSMIFFGMGSVFVWPYENATKAQLYLVLKHNFIASNVVNAELLNC